MRTLEVNVTGRVPLRARARLKAALVGAWLGLDWVPRRLPFQYRVGSGKWHTRYLTIDVEKK